MRKFKIIFLLLFALLIVSCETVTYIAPDLPTFEPVRPQRPQLEEVLGEVPEGAIINTVRLMEYSRELEVYSNAWENYYNSLREEFENV